MRRMGPREGGASARRAQQRGAATRQKILEAALRAFAAHGYEGAMTREIAAAAGVHQPVINYHFDGKEGLWRAAIDFAFGELRDTFAARLREVGNDDPEATLRALLRDFVLFNARHPEFPRVLVHAASAPTPRLKWIVDRHLRPMFESVTAQIERARSAGHWPTIAAASFYHIMNGAATSIFVIAPAVAMASGIDPLSEENSLAHADAVAELFFPNARAETKRKRSGGARGHSRRAARAGESRDRRRGR
jgi:AcrR family transcriptional regulator